MLIRKILFFTLIITTIHSQSIQTQPVWFNNLINYLQVKSGTYQVFLIIDNDHLDNRRNLLFQIPKSFPTERVDFHCFTEPGSRCLENHQFLQDSRAVNLFLIAPSANASKFSSQMNRTIDSLIGISKAQTRPKCLIVLSAEEEELNYKKLLKNLWRKQFLDATVLEINGKPMMEDYYTTMKSNQFAKVVQYNPFLKRFSITVLSSKTELFLEKLDNLHQQQIKVAFVSVFPLVNVTRNVSGHVTKISGTDANIIRFLAKELNFSLMIVPHNYTDFGSFNPVVDKKPGLTYWLTKNKINIMGNRVLGTEPADSVWSVVGQPIDDVSLSAIVPIQKAKVSSLVAVSDMLVCLIIFIIMMVLLFSLARILKFDHALWQPLVLLRIFIGQVVDRDTKRIADRLMFTLLLFTTMILSMHFYNICTNLSIHHDDETRMDTLDDLINSQLKSKMSNLLKNLLIRYSEGSIKIVLNSSQDMPLNSDVKCFEELANYRNICCISNSIATQFAVQSYRNYENEPIMKIIPENLYTSWYYLFFERGSPYAPRFNEIILRVKESGIRHQLEERMVVKRDKKLKNSESKEFEKINELLRYFFYVFIIGDCLLIVVFCLEIFISKRNFLH